MEKEKRAYSSFSNQCYIYKSLWKYDKSAVIFAVFEVILQVASNFLLILLPAMVIKMLELKLSVKDMAIGTMGVFAIYGLLSAVSTFFVRRNRNQYIEFRAGTMIRGICRKIMSVDYVQYESDKIQKLMGKAMDAVGGNNWGLEGTLHLNVRALVGILGLILYTILIANVHYLIILLLLAISVIQFICYRLVNQYEYKNKDKKAGLDITKKYFDKQAYDVNAGKDIRLYHLKDWLTGKYEEANKKYQALIGKERSRYFANDLLGLALQLIREGICYFYLIGLLKEGMEISDFVLYMGLIASFSMSFNEITVTVMEIGRFQKMIDFLREFLDLKTIFHHGDGLTLDEKSKAIKIEFSHVSFFYPKTEEEPEPKLILDDISFTMNPGEKLALVGINGAGKTTIVKLMCGFYRPTKGHIYINGIDIEDLDLEDYYKYLAVVFQEAFLPSFSIAENVACRSKEELNLQECREAIRKAGLWEKVDSLPKKELTHINKDIEEDGIQLSGGQIQKLMLARASYKDCKIVLLDEPTAALDAIAEHEVYQKYEEVISGKTALFISHRLASTRFCDKILFLENGKIVEEGTHNELINLSGRYAHMFEIQSKYYREEEKYEAKVIHS